jgi:hypothetical protein
MIQALRFVPKHSLNVSRFAAPPQAIDVKRQRRCGQAPSTSSHQQTASAQKKKNDSDRAQSQSDADVRYEKRFGAARMYKEKFRYCSAQFASTGVSRQCGISLLFSAMHGTRL